MSHFDPPLDEREKFGIPVESVRNVNIDEYESRDSYLEMFAAVQAKREDLWVRRINEQLFSALDENS